MAINNNDIIRITAKFSVNANDVQNVYHMRVTTSGPVDDEDFLDEVAADIDSMYDEIQTFFHQSVNFDTIEVYNLTQDSYVGETDWPVKTTGDGTQDRLAVQCAALCLFPTAQLRSQGRKFLPPMSESCTTSGGEVSTAVLAYIGNFIADVLAAKTGVNWEGHMGNWNKDLMRFAQWTSGIAKSAFATQRRRYLGSGS